MKTSKRGKPSDARLNWPKTNNNALRRACDLLLLSLYTHLLPIRGLEARTMELVLESQLQVVFQQVHYRDRNVALIKKEGGIMLHLGRFTKAKHTGHEKNSNTGNSYHYFIKLCDQKQSFLWHIFLMTNCITLFLPYESPNNLMAMINDQGKIKV